MNLLLPAILEIKRATLARWAAAMAVLCVVSILGGCGDRPASEDPESANEDRRVELRVLLIGQDDRFAANLERLFSAQDRGSLTLTRMTRDEFLEQVKERPEADVIVYPQDMLGELIRRNAISELPKHVTHADSLQRLGVLDLERRVSATWGSQTMGFSLGSPQLMLLYRKDMLSSIGESPPETWSDYQRIADKLRAELDEPESSDKWISVVEPLHADWIAKLLLARSAGYIRHPSRFSDVFDFVTLAPTINLDPFVRALRELKATVGDAAADLKEVTPDDATDMIFAGQCAMAIGIIRPSESLDFEASELGNEIGIVPLPTSREVYSFSQSEWEPRPEDEATGVTILGVDGCLASVVNLSRRTSSAQEFLLWLAGPEESFKIAPWSPHSAPFRREHLERVGVWCDPRLVEGSCQDYGDFLEQHLTRSLWMTMPRLPGAHEYMESLSEAATLAIDDEADPSTALDQAANEWRAITSRLGEAEQRQAYERSLLLN